MKIKKLIEKLIKVYNKEGDAQVTILVANTENKLEISRNPGEKGSIIIFGVKK